MQHFYHNYNLKLVANLKYLWLLLFFTTSYANAQSDAPEINVELNGVTKLNGSDYAFAEQNVNTNSNAATFTIQNNGTANLNISDITLSGPDANQFTLTKNTPTAVTTGSTTTFTVTFSPKNNAPNQKNAVITIVNDDEDEGSYAINVTGTTVILEATITSLNPVRAAIGAVVTITGTNLINTTSVAFDGVPATNFTVVSNTTVRATVPAGATSGPISVTNEAGTAISTQTFFVTPRITSLSSTAGPIGSTVVINGTSFTGATSIKFNGREAASKTVVNDNQITATVPEGATIGTVTVTTPSGTGTSTQTFTPPPTFTSLNATSGIIGDVITITGTNFPNLATTVVRFTGKTGTNAITATRTVVSNTQITVTIPVGAVTGPITITTIAGAVSSPEFNIINTTYTWNNATGNGNWSDLNNWTPARTSPTSNDILVFDGAVTASPVITLDFASPETIGYLGISNNAAVTFTVAADKALTIDNVNASSLADFVVAAGSSLTVTNSVGSGGADLTINIASGETGSVAGTVTFQGAEPAEHRLIATNTNSLTFASGGRFIAGTNLSGSPFAGGIKSSVTFANGANYINRAIGSLPFGAASPNAVVVFNTTSTYSHEVNSVPDVVNRTYGNFIITNVAGATTAFDQTVAEAGNLRILNNFTQTAPAGVPAPNFNLNLIGNITVSNVLTVSSGTLSFNPASTSTITVTGNLVTNNSGILNFNPSSPLTVSLGGSITLNSTSRLNADNTSELTTVRLTGANRTISGPGVFFLGTKANLSVETGASVTLAKSITGTGTVTVNGTVRTANVNGLAGGAATSFINPLQVTLNPGSTVDYNAPNNQTVSGLDYSNLIISGVRTNRVITLPGSLRVSRVFSLTATGTNVTYNTTTNNNTIEFNGAAQVIPNAFPYNNLIISGTGDKTLTTNVTVNGILNLKEANKILTNGNILTLGPTATLTGEATGQYVVGTLRTTRPVGSSGSDFGGIGVTLGAGANLGNVTIIRISGPNSSVKVGNYLGINRTWSIEPTTQPTSSVNVTLTWVEEDNNGKILTAARVWKTEGDDVNTYYDVSKEDQDASDHSITVTVKSFSIFTVSDQNNPLPVELISFNAAKKGSSAILTWQTATEQNNQGFAVEVSEDARVFKEVSFLKSADANSSTVQSYAFTHRATKAGTWYYRLKQTDWSGATRYYGPKAITFDLVTPALAVYPNPLTSNTSALSVVVGSSGPEKADITVTDILGKVVYRKSILVDPAQNEIKVDLGNQAAGVYIIQVATPSTGINQARIIKQ